MKDTKNHERKKKKNGTLHPSRMTLGRTPLALNSCSLSPSSLMACSWQQIWTESSCLIYTGHGITSHIKKILKKRQRNSQERRKKKKIPDRNWRYADCTKRPSWRRWRWNSDGLFDSTGAGRSSGPRPPFRTSPWKHHACSSTTLLCRRPPCAKECWAFSMTEGPGRRKSRPSQSCYKRRKWHRPACPSWDRSSTNLPTSLYSIK